MVELKEGDRVFVLINNPVTNKNVWHPGKVTGFTSGEVYEDHKRVNVRLDDGREFFGCHPSCIKKFGREVSNA